MSPNNGYKTTYNTLYHKAIEISSVLSCSWLFFYLPNTCFSCFWIELIKGEKSEGQIKNKSNCASSVCVQTNAPRARWGSTPIPFDITVETGDELSVTDAKREEGWVHVSPLLHGFRFYNRFRIPVNTGSPVSSWTMAYRNGRLSSTYFILSKSGAHPATTTIVDTAEAFVPWRFTSILAFPQLFASAYSFLFTGTQIALW